MSTDKLSVEEYLILKQSLDQITPPEQENVSYSGNGTAGREADVRPTGFVFQMPPQRTWVGLTDEETRGCIEATIEITDPLLLDAVNAVIIDVERLLRKKNT